MSSSSSQPISVVSMIHFSGLVVTLNEDKRLPECLASLSFCEEIIVFDLGSVDGSVQVARDAGAKVIRGKREMSVEKVWPVAVQHTHNNWIVRLDPDEVFPAIAVPHIASMIESDATIGALSLPHQFYFLGKPLRTTMWGGIKQIGRVFHRDRVSYERRIHQGLELRDGYRLAAVPERDDFILHHYWADNIAGLIAKHARYAREEAALLAESGERFTWNGLARAVVAALKGSLIDARGWRQGPVGIFLSLFHAWYAGARVWSLRRLIPRDRSK